MNKKLKIAIVGSGSTYTPELIDGFINLKKTLPITNLTFMDIDDRKMTIVGGLCERMLKAANYSCEAVFTKNLDEALIDASFVITQIRVGKLAARIRDEKIPMKYHLLGQETTGIGGFMKAMRSIPEINHIADRMKVLCPDAYLINFTNPSGIVTEAVQKHGFDKVIGLCNVPINMITSVKEQLGMPDAHIEYVGLNHLSWITKITNDGENITEQAIQRGVKSELMNNIPPSQLDKDITKVVGAIYSPYLEYYYDRNGKIKHNEESKTCRGEDCLEIEENLLKLYSGKELCHKPALLDKRGGHRYSEVAVSLINAIYNDLKEIQILNVKNQGIIDFLKDDDVVEVACRVDKNGAHPLPITPVDNGHIRSLMQSVKEYERKTVEAGLTGDRITAQRALLIHPLLGDFNTLQKCLNEMLEANKSFLPQFYEI